MIDEFKHFVINLVLAFLLCFINIYLAVITCIVISIGKELYDKYKGNKISISDLIADTLGIICGVGIHLCWKF